MNLAQFFNGDAADARVKKHLQNSLVTNGRQKLRCSTVPTTIPTKINLYFFISVTKVRMMGMMDRQQHTTNNGSGRREMAGYVSGRSKEDGSVSSCSESNQRRSIPSSLCFRHFPPGILAMAPSFRRSSFHGSSSLLHGEGASYCSSWRP